MTEDRLEGGQGVLLSGTKFRERWTEPKMTQAFAGPLPQRKKFRHALELGAKERIVGRGEHDRLHESAAHFDEDELSAQGRWNRSFGF